MQTQNQGAYRSPAKNPHKAAYDREESLRRLRKNAGWRIQRLKARLDSWERAHQEMADECDQLRGQLMSLKSEAWKLVLTVGFVFVAFLGLAFFFVTRMGELEAENAALLAEHHALAMENSGLRSSLEWSTRREAGLRDELTDRHLDVMIARSQLRTCQRSVEDMRLTAARLDGRISTLEILCAHGSVQTVNADRIVVDEYGATCRESELLGPEGTCPSL